MATENRNGVVMGIPADYFRPRPRNEEPIIITTAPEPLPCNNPDRKLHLCMKWLVLTFFVLFVLFIYLSFPGFYLKNGAPIIQIESITPSKIASFNNNTIFTDWHLAFSLENPNKYVSIRYKKIQVSASDRDKRLSSGNVDYFYQDKREVGRMNVEILGLVFNLEKEKINEAGEMVFTMKLDAVVWLEKKYMKNHWQLLEANCGDVRVRPSMSLMLDGSGRCNVNLQ